MCADLQQVVESMKESMNEMTASLLAKSGELEARERLVEETTVQLNQAKAKVSVYSLMSIFCCYKQSFSLSVDSGLHVVVCLA